MEIGPLNWLIREENFAGPVSRCNRMLKILIVSGLLYTALLVYAEFFAKDKFDVKVNIAMESTAILAYIFVLTYRKFVPVNELYWSYNAVRIHNQAI